MATTSATGDLTQTATELSQLPRSERIKRLFGLELFGYQAEIADAPESGVVVTCGRQVGKTEVGAAIALDGALFNPGEDVMVAALWQETADELFRRSKELVRQGPFTKEQLGVVRDNSRQWEFSHGGRIYSRSLNASSGSEYGDAQRGKLPKVVIVDESAVIHDRVFEEVIEPMFATHGDTHELYLFSTPRGKSGYHYRKHVYDDAWNAVHVPTSASPLVDEDWLERKQADIDQLTWKQEYCGEFVEEADAYLPHDIVDPCVRPDPESADTYDTDARRVLGVDVARQGRDRTVYYDLGTDGVTRQVLSEDQSTIDGVVGRLTHLHEQNDYAVILVDENGLGGGVVDFGQAGLGRVVREFTFSTKGKQTLYQSLRKSLESGELVLPDDDRLIGELTSLQYDYTQHGYLKVSHPEGGHDDHPDALALANHARQRIERLTRRRQARRSSDNDGISYL